MEARLQDESDCIEIHSSYNNTSEYLNLVKYLLFTGGVNFVITVGFTKVLKAKWGVES